MLVSDGLPNWIDRAGLELMPVRLYLGFTSRHGRDMEATDDGSLDFVAPSLTVEKRAYA